MVNIVRMSFTNRSLNFKLNGVGPSFRQTKKHFSKQYRKPNIFEESPTVNPRHPGIRHSVMQNEAISSKMLPEVIQHEKPSDPQTQRHHKVTIRLTAKIPIGQIQVDQDYTNSKRETERRQMKSHHPARITVR